MYLTSLLATPWQVVVSDVLACLESLIAVLDATVHLQVSVIILPPDA